MKSGKAYRSTFLTCIILCLLTWGGIGSFIAALREAELRDGQREAYLTSRLFAEQVSRVLRSVESTLNFAAYELALRPEGDTIRTLVERGVLQMDNLVLLTFADAQGVTVGSNLGPDNARTNLADREHIRVHLEGLTDGVYVSKPVLGRVSGKWSIQVTRRVQGADGRLLGVVVASLDPHYFQRFWKDMVGQAGVIELIGLDGVLRTRSLDTDWALHAQLDRSSVAARAEGASSGSFVEAGPDKVERLSAFVRLDNLPLLVVTGYARDVVLARVQPTVMRYFGLGLAATIVIIAFGFRLVHIAEQLERKEREEVAARRRLTDAVEASSDGFMLFDAQDRLVIANSSQKRLYPEIAYYLTPGRTYEEIIRAGQAAGAFKTPPGMDDEEYLQGLLEAHRAPQGSFEVKVGEERWVRVAERRTASGEIVGVRSDISDLKRREAELQRLAGAAQQASEAKSSFIAAMSHEIRTPLNAIVGFSGLMMKTALDDEQKSYAHTIDVSANHLLDIVNDVLDFAQIESGRLTLNRMDFSIRDSVRSLEGTLGALIGDKPIVIKVEIDARVPAYVTGDPLRLYQVLLNLGGNAAKFTSAGAITIRVAPVGDAPGLIRFEVADTGKGIEKDAQASIFNAFEQGDDDALRHEGTGLGLTISQRLVRCMGGDIHVESEPGRGARFWFDTPLPAAAPPQETAGDELAPDRRRLNVLVTDDTPSSRLLMSALLRKEGHRVAEARNGREACDLVATGDFDLVLMDLQMPIMGGIEAARAIRKMPGAAGQVPIVALTAQVFEKDRLLAFEAGMNDFLPKPFTTTGLSRVMRSVRERDGAGDLHAAGAA